MSEPKWTPGPWSFELALIGGFEIAKDPHDIGSYTVIATRYSHPERIAEMHANARLIAAAPELYEALANATAQLDQCIKDLGGCDHEVGICMCTDIKAVESARAALAKARGES